MHDDAGTDCYLYGNAVRRDRNNKSRRRRSKGRVIGMPSSQRRSAGGAPDVLPKTRSSSAAQALMEIAAILALTKTETAWLFNVSAKTVRSWYKDGVPIKRVAEVENLADLTRALQERFIPERIPQIARQSIPGLNDRSILQAIRVSGPTTVLHMLERAFSYVPR